MMIVVIASCDGMGVLLQLLKSEGIPVLLYIAVELDDDAFLTTLGNHGDYAGDRDVERRATARGRSR